MVDVDNSKVKLMIAGNTPENLEAAGKILEKEQYDIHIANSAQNAMELFDNIQVDLILLDIMMTAMDEFEIYKHIRENAKLNSIPIVLLTDMADDENINKVFEYGASDYIRKPLNELELITKVKNYAELKKIKEELGNKNKQLEEAFAELKIIATTDSLTKLFNKREMLRKIDYEIIRFERNKSKFALIMADIDCFKEINDNYGHGCGDFILKGVADIIKESVRKQDFVARWGGDEFLLLLPETTQEGAGILAEKIRTRIEQVIFKFDGKDIKLTMTFGVSEYLEDKEANDILKLAYQALRKGKDNEKNCVALYETNE